LAIQYVGGRGGGRAGSTSTLNVAINSGLSGGIGSAALAGDLVIVTIAVGTQERNPSCAVSGYTALTQQHTTATTYDISVCTSYKIMPDPPDTTVTIPSTGNSADGQGYEIHVFRGVDPTTPLDGVTPTYATGSGTDNRPNPAAITPSTTGAWIYCGGGGAASTGTTVFTASYLSGFLSHNGADTNDGTAGAGYYSGWTSGSYDPAVWGGGSVNAANSWGATTLVLRPAATATPQAVAGTLNLSGTVGKQTAKQFAGPLTAVGILNRQTSLELIGPGAFSGTLGTNLIQAVQQAVAGIFGFAGSVGRQIFKSVVGTFTGTGLLNRTSGLPESGVAAFAGGITFTFSCLLSGGISFDGLAEFPSSGGSRGYRQHTVLVGHTGMGF
jgi:hypothetical protein